jgi:Gpi16 subunit, GPI transamidase component
VHWFLRFETHQQQQQQQQQQQLVTTATTPTTSTTSTNTHPESSSSSSSSSSSPFFFTPLSPPDIPSLLQSYQADRILIQVSNAASSSFPSSPLLDGAASGIIIPPLGSSEGQNNNASKKSDDSSAIHSPAGVRIAVDFVLQENDPAEDGSSNNDGSSSNDLVDRFVALLQEISARRWVLASLASAQEPRRLHRFIHQEEAPAEPFNKNDKNYNSTSKNTKMMTRRHRRLSIMLPTDGHALSAEAMVAFTTAFNPCASSNNKAAAQAGLWSLLTPMTWSNLLLGNHHATQNVGAGRRERRRGFWIDIQLKHHHHHHHHHEQQLLLHQQYTISQGLYYTRTTSKAVAQGISLRELLSVETATAAPPTAATTTTTSSSSSWSSCPLADDTLLVVVAPDASSSSNIKVSTSLACQKYKRRQPATTATATTIIGDENDSLARTVTELDMKSIDMTSQCLEVVVAAQPDSSSKPSKTKTATTTTTTTKYNYNSLPLPDVLWQVHLDVQRPAGVARHGTILTTILNHDADCSAHVVSAVQVIPPVITPIWHSLKIHLFAANSTTALVGTATGTSSFPHPTVSWKDDGFMVLSFAGTLPANTAVQLALDYDPAFLPFEQFPADANRGFDLVPVQAHMRRSLDCKKENPTTRLDATTATLYSDSVTILAPLPDRSMPFNVLSLSCTLFAFILGSLVNILVRKSSERVKFTLHPDQKPKSSMLQLVKEMIKGRIQRLRQKLSFRKTSNSGSLESSLSSTQQAKAGDDDAKEKTE